MRSQQVLDGRYRLEDRLGAGGMSVVWRATDLVLQRPVAVKLLANKHAISVAARQRIRAEARAAARLWHPNVTGVFDYGESTDDDGSRIPYVVMELLPGRNLAQRLDDGPIPPRVALRILSEVATAIAAAHAQGLVHRDVKPSNVMLTPSGAKVVDFGIAAVVGRDEMEADGLLLGTPAYLAPERLTLGQVSPASDIYALGLLIYQALSDRLPWLVETTTQMLDAHVYVEPEPLPPLGDVPPEVNEVCDRCLAKEPADRPLAGEVAAVLARAAGIVPPPEDDDPAMPGLVAAMAATTDALRRADDAMVASGAPQFPEGGFADEPAPAAEPTTVVVGPPRRKPPVAVAGSAAKLERDHRRQRLLTGVVTAVVVAGAVLAAIFVPNHNPGGTADATVARPPGATAPGVPTRPGATPADEGTPDDSTPPRPDGGGGDDNGSDTDTDTTVGQGTVPSGGGTGQGGSGTGAEPETTTPPDAGDPGAGAGGEDGAGDPPPATDPPVTPGPTTVVKVLGISVDARCVGDKVEVLDVRLGDSGYGDSSYPSGPRDSVTIQLLPLPLIGPILAPVLAPVLDPILVTLVCRDGRPVRA